MNSFCLCKYILPNLVDVMVMSVLRKCVGVPLFPGEHCFEQEPELNHVIPLMIAICKKYFKVRLHHFSKTVTENLHKTKLRSLLSKTVTFMGQLRFCLWNLFFKYYTALKSLRIGFSLFYLYKLLFVSFLYNFLFLLLLWCITKQTCETC